MASQAKAHTNLTVQRLDKGEPLGAPRTLMGREAWTMRQLIQAGENGVSSLDHVGPRLSHYIFKLRGYGFAIETVDTKHGGEFPGVHAVYKLRTETRVVEAEKVAA